MKRLLILPLLLAVTQAQSAVECTNQNVKISPTTPTVEFVLHEDGTATHGATGLMWMRCSLGRSWNGSTCTGTGIPTAATWQGALQLAADINTGNSDDDNDGLPGFAGHTDWRLPNRNELESIVEERCWSPVINAAVFPSTPDIGMFWSSSPRASNSSDAWHVNFGQGNVYWFNKSDLLYVRLVRAGQ